MASKYIGAVAYVDNMTVFRIVYPLEHEDESVLDDPQWVTLGCDPARPAALFKVDPSDAHWGDQFSAIPAIIDPRGFVLS